MTVRKLAIRAIAPPAPAEADDYDDQVWLLNLDQIESHTGRLLSKQMVARGSVGTSTHAFDAGNVLYSKLRPYLNKVFLPEESGFCTTELVPLRPNPNLVRRDYLAAYLRSPKFLAWVDQQVDGAKMPRVSMKVFWAHEIELPTLDEQKRIAAILDKADSLRRKRQQAIRLADDFLRAVFLDLFGDLQTNPKAWDSVPLGELIQEGPTNGLYCPSDMYGSGTPILRIDGFYDGRLLPDYEFKRVRIDEKTQKRYDLKKNSIVVNRVNSREFVGKAAYVGKLAEPTVFESNMMNLTLNPERADQVFIVEQMRFPYIRSQMATARKDAVNQSSVNQDDIRNLTVRLPPVYRQAAFRKVYEKHGELQKLFKPSSLEAVAAIKALQASYLA